MQVIQGHDDARREELLEWVIELVVTGLLLIEFAMPSDVVSQVAASQEVHEEVEVVAVLEGADHVDEEAGR